MTLDDKKIDKARKLLGLGEEATILEIKDAFRKLSLKYHPDKCPKKDKSEYEEKFKKINNANETLIDFCLNYRFSFKEAKYQETFAQKHAKDHLKRFYDGWWGELKDV